MCGREASFEGCFLRSLLSNFDNNTRTATATTLCATLSYMCIRRDFATKPVAAAATEKIAFCSTVNKKRPTQLFLL